MIDQNINTDNPLHLQHNIVFVGGNLKVHTDKLPLIGMQSMGFADDSYRKNACGNNIIENDLVINDDNAIEYSSFTTFIIKGDIIYYEVGDANLPFPIGETDVYEERRKDFYQLLESVNDDSPQLLLQLLYTSIFSRFEYAVIQNVLYFLRYKQGEIFSFFKGEKPSELKQLVSSDIPDGEKELNLMSIIRENIYAGNIRFLKKLFLTVFDESIEALATLNDGYLKRNSIVHRAGCDKYGYPMIITKEELRSMAKTVDEFTTYLNDMCRSAEKKWVDHFLSEQGLPPLQKS